MKPRTRTVGVVVLNDRKVLLVRHGEKSRQPNGIYGFPAGRVESEETDLQAAVRELREESGLIAKDADLIQLPTVYESTLELKNGPEDFLYTVFYCPSYTGEIVTNEEQVPEWIDLDRLSEYWLLPNIAQAIEEAQTWLNR